MIIAGLPVTAVHTVIRDTEMVEKKYHGTVMVNKVQQPLYVLSKIQGLMSLCHNVNTFDKHDS